MGEALAAFGAICGSAGLISFYLNTIKTLHDKKFAFADCKHQLSCHDTRLVVLQERLKGWKRFWAGRRNTKTNVPCREIWGEEGGDFVQRQLDLIREEVQGIQSRLHGSNELNHEEESWWKEFLSHGRTRKPTKVEVGLLDRIVFAMYKDNYLDGRVTMLTTLIDGLEKSSQIRWVVSQDLDSVEQVTSQDVKIQQRGRELCAALSVTYHSLLGQQGVWALLLQQVDPSNMCLLTAQDHLNIELLHTEPSFERPRVSRRISVPYHFDTDGARPSTLLSSLLEAANEVLPSESTAIVGLHMRSLLNFIVSQHEQREQEKLRQGTAYDRSKVALCIATWVASLWSSDWIKGLCNCSIRQARLQQASKMPMMVHRELKNDQCFPDEVYMRRHLLLGIVLSELALAQPLGVTCDGYGTIFTLRNISAHMNEEVITQNVLLSLVERSTSIPYREAVMYCFAWDELDRANSAEAQTTTRTKVGDIHRYSDTALPRLLEHHRRIAQYRDSRMAIYQKFETLPSIACY